MTCERSPGWNEDGIWAVPEASADCSGPNPRIICESPGLQSAAARRLVGGRGAARAVRPPRPPGAVSARGVPARVGPAGLSGRLADVTCGGTAMPPVRKMRTPSSTVRSGNSHTFARVDQRCRPDTGGWSGCTPPVASRRHRRGCSVNSRVRKPEDVPAPRVLHEHDPLEAVLVIGRKGGNQLLDGRIHGLEQRDVQQPGSARRSTRLPTMFVAATPRSARGAR